MISKSKGLQWLFLSAVVIIIDQLTKYAVVHHLGPQQLPLLSFLNISLAYNSGASFSFLHNAGGWQRYALSAIALLVSVYIVYYLRKMQPVLLLPAMGLSLILGGAIGNVIDRIRLGYVVDFVDFHIKTWHFATFNMADSAISVGAVLLLISFLKTEKS